MGPTFPVVSAASLCRAAVARLALCALVVVGGLWMTMPGDVAARSDPLLAVRQATIAVRTTPVGDASLRIFTSGRHDLFINAHDLPARRLVYVALSRGACGSLGARLWTLRVSTSPSGTLGVGWTPTGPQLTALTAALKAGRVSVTIGSAGRCGTFSPATRCAPAGRPQTWRMLVLIYPEAAFDYTDEAGARASFRSRMTNDEIADSKAAAVGIPNEVTSATGGAATVALTVSVSTVPLSRVHPTTTSPGEVFASPDDTAPDVALAAPGLSFDAVLVIWKPWAEDGSALPLKYAGYGQFDAARARTHANIVLLNIQGIPTVRMDSMLHEWLHGVIYYLTTFGYKIPDLHAPIDKTYKPDIPTGWLTYLHDFMAGTAQFDDGTVGGITRAEWESGSSATRPQVCAWTAG